MAGTEELRDIADTSEFDDAFDAIGAGATPPPNSKHGRVSSSASSTASAPSLASPTASPSPVNMPPFHPGASPSPAAANGRHQHISFDMASPLGNFTPFSPSDPNYVQAPPTAVTAAVYSDTTLLQNEVTQLKKQVNDARTRAHELDEENQTLQQQARQVKSIQDTNDSLSKRVLDLEKSLAASMAATEEVRAAAPRSADANVSSLQDQVADLRKKLTQKENEIAEVRAKYEDVLAKQDKLESDLLFHKKRYEHTSTRLTKEHELETNALKASFAEVSEKRKQAFLQLKEKLKQAGVIVQKQTASIKDHQSKLAEANKTIAELKASMSTKDQEEAKIKQDRSDAELLLAKERGNWELQASIHERDANEYRRKVDQLQDQLSKALMQLEMMEQKETASQRYACNITYEGHSCETGLPYKVKSALPSDSRIRYQWYRSFRGSHFVPITGGLGAQPTYVATVDDIGATLKAECSTSTLSVSAEVGPILPSRALIAAIAEILKKMDVSFPIESTNEPGVKGKYIQLNKEKIKLRNANKTIHKAVYSDHVKVTLDGDVATKFNMQLDDKKLILSYNASTPKERDLVVLTIRTVNLHQLQKEREKANKIEKPSDALIALASQIRTQNETSGGAEAETVHRASRSRPSISISASANTNTTSISVTPATGGHHAPADSIDLFSGMLQSSTLVPPSTPGTQRNKKQSMGDDIIDKILSSSKTEKEAPVFDFATGTMTAVPAQLPPPSGAVAPVPIPSQITASPGSQRGNKPPPIDYKHSNKKDEQPTHRKGSDSISLSANEPPKTPTKQQEKGKEKEKDRVQEKEKEKPSGKKGQEPEVDAEGYIIQPRRGFDDYGTADKFDSDDEDGAGGGDAEPSGPAIKVVINKESRAIASAETLRSQMAGLAIAPKKKKGEKEKKKKTKKKDSMFSTDTLDREISSTNSVSTPPHATSPTSLQIHPQASPSESKSIDELSANPASTPTSSAPTLSAPTSILDPTVETSNAPLESLGSPTKATPSKSTSMSPVNLPIIHPTTSLSPTASLSPPSPSNALPVEVNITETMHARIQQGKITEFAVLGEIVIVLQQPTTVDSTYDLHLSHIDGIKLTPNISVCTTTSSGIYSIAVPKGSTNVVMGKYKVLSDLDKARSLVPISVNIAWTVTQGQTLIDINYEVLKASLSDVKFGLALAPDKSIKACTLATPKCMFSPSAQKMLWQFATLPESGGSSTGKLHAELSTDRETTPTPLNVSFAHTASDALVSGVIVDSPTQQITYRMKSGIFTVQ